MNTPKTPSNPYTAAMQSQGPETLANLLKEGGYRQRFEKVLGERAPQFISSILTVGAKLRDVEPRSIIGSAAIAASLDLPIDPNLGFAHIVPYKNGGVKYGQFQMGYKGYIQLALRSGNYCGMNAKAVNAEALTGFDRIGRPVIDWGKLDETKPVAGYVFGYTLLAAPTEPWLFYWPREKVIAHAKRYSQAFKGDFETPWKTHFDAMALKTVISNELRKWGMLSVQLQRAFATDQGIIHDIDAEVQFPDTIDSISISRPEFDGDKKEEAAAGLAPEPQETGKTAKCDKSRDKSSLERAEPQGGAAPTDAHNVGSAGLTPAPATGPQLQPIDPEDTSKPHIVLAQLMEGVDRAELTQDEVMEYCKRHDLATAVQTSLSQLATRKLVGLCERWPEVVQEIRATRV